MYVIKIYKLMLHYLLLVWQSRRDECKFIYLLDWRFITGEIFLDGVVLRGPFDICITFVISTITKSANRIQDENGKRTSR